MVSIPWMAIVPLTTVRIPILFILPIILYFSSSFINQGRLLDLLFFKRKKSALVQSIAEHFPRNFYKNIMDLHFIVFLLPLSIVEIFDLESIYSSFMLIYLIMSIVLSSKMTRLILIASPCFYILIGIFINNTYEKLITNKKKVLYFLLIPTILLYSFHCILMANKYYSVPEIVILSSENEVLNDFIEANKWINENINGIILSWWDYGYQINAMTKLTTLNDNNTNDWEKITDVSRILLSTESEAYQMCKNKNIDYIYIVSGVFSGYDQDYIEKSYWIEKIATENANFQYDINESIIIKMCYFNNGVDFYDYVRNIEYGSVNLTLFKNVFNSENKIVKIYQVK